jgi:hypothetical protein
MRISWVILQRRLPRRSAWVEREDLGLVGFTIKSNGDAIANHLFPKNRIS